MSEQLQQLEALLQAVAARLPDTSSKRLFGCRALYRSDAVFALVWKTGRIAVKLPVEAECQELMSLRGAEPWVAHAVMKQWVLVPKAFHKDQTALLKWLRLAHASAGEQTRPASKRAKARDTKTAPRPAARVTTSGTAMAKKATRTQLTIKKPTRK